jgi:carbon monoxide dehydrogenase subunit G
MKLIAAEDIAAPVDAVWARLADMDTWERQTAKRIGSALRRDPPGPAAPGTTWTGEAEIRGRRMPFAMTLREVTVPERIVLAGTLGGVDLSVIAAAAPLGASATRLDVTIEATARGIAAKLALQGAKLAQGRIEAGLRKGVARLAASIEQRADEGRAGGTA